MSDNKPTAQEYLKNKGLTGVVTETATGLMAENSEHFHNFLLINVMIL